MRPLTSPPAVVTAGASMLADALRRQAVEVSPVLWQPPAGDPASLATVMGDPRRRAANASFTCCGVSEGLTSRISSATPATNGVAMLVPLQET